MFCVRIQGSVGESSTDSQHSHLIQIWSNRISGLDRGKVSPFRIIPISFANHVPCTARIQNIRLCSNSSGVSGSDGDDVSPRMREMARRHNVVTRSNLINVEYRSKRLQYCSGLTTATKTRLFRSSISVLVVGDFNFGQFVDDSDSHVGPFYHRS